MGEKSKAGELGCGSKGAQTRRGNFPPNASPRLMLWDSHGVGGRLRERRGKQCSRCLNNFAQKMVTQMSRRNTPRIENLAGGCLYSVVIAERANWIHSRLHNLMESVLNWSPQSGGTPADDAGWNEMLASLQAFKNEHGHCRVPGQWSGNPKLANWVATQRRFKKHGELKAERIAALDGIGFEWIIERRGTLPLLNQRANMLTATQAWDAMFFALQQYKQAHGNCLVPQRCKENQDLQIGFQNKE